MAKWISVKDRLPLEFVSVLGVMKDTEIFPQVRECYRIGAAFFFPSLRNYGFITHWAEMPEPPKEGE